MQPALFIACNNSDGDTENYIIAEDKVPTEILKKIKSNINNRGKLYDVVYQWFYGPFESDEHTVTGLKSATKIRSGTVLPGNPITFITIFEKY